MDRLRSLEVFVEIIDRGSMSRAADALRMSPAMVTTHLAQLEARLGKKLLDRSTRRLDLTREGRRFLEDTRRILAGLRAAEDTARGTGTAPRGRVRIDAPASVGHHYLLPAIPAFRAVYPEVAIDLSLGDRGIVFRPDGFDVLIRVGETHPDNAEVRVLGSTRMIMVAAPDYLARCGTPLSLDDIQGHDCIIYAAVDEPGGHRWSFTVNGATRWLRPNAILSFNDGDAIAAAAVAGLGIARTLEMLVVDELASGRLIRLCTDLETEPMSISAFAPDDRCDIPAVAAVLDFLGQIDWTGAVRGT
jgi:DNA-binding transcriptional LysR family regulator